MNDKELEKIQEEIMKEIDKDQKAEQEIITSSEEIASHLLASKKVNAEIKDTVYMFSYRLLERGDKKIIYILVANVTKYKIIKEKYVPFSATAEMDQRYSELDNVKTVVETFIRHVMDRIKPEILDGE